MKKWYGKLVALFTLAFLLTACGGNSTTSNSASDSNAPEATGQLAEIEKLHPARIENEGEPVEGATLKVAVVSESGFKGVFNGYFYSDAIDDYFMKYTMDGAFPLGDDMKFIQDSDETPIKMTVNEDEKTVTYKINPKFKWSNGEQVTTADIVKTYEIVANQDFIKSSESPRYGGSMKNIVGIEDYNQGKADKISGLEVIDDSNLVIHLKEITPSALWGDGFATEFVNAKQLEGIPMDKIVSSDAVRKNPLSYGPYQMVDQVSGESITYKANPYYYKGEAKVKDLVMTILPPSQQVASMKSGAFDIYLSAQTSVYPEIKDLPNMKIASRLDLYMSYLGFKLGTWDKENNLVITNPDAKMGDINLRKAMSMAIDNDAIGVNFYHGLRFKASTPIAPTFENLHDKSITGIPYDMEGAKKLLDDAGYKDTDNDGFREDKNGNKLVINYAAMGGSDVAEPIAQYYLQQWKDIGLNVELVNGRLLDLHNFYDLVENDDPSVDVYGAAFGLASDPNVYGLFGKDEAFNMMRYTSDTFQAALEKLGTNEMMDPEKQAQAYHEFEKVFLDELPMCPLQNRVAILPINNRVKLYDFNYNEKESGFFDWSKIELTAADPIAAQ